jgi:hypothetical protein
MKSSLRAPQKTSLTDSSIVEVSGLPILNVISSSKRKTTENVGQSRKFVPLDPEKFKTAVQQGGISAKKSQRGAPSLSLVIDCHLT